MTIQLSLEYGAVSPLDLQAGGYIVLDGIYPSTATGLDAHVTERFNLEIIASSETDLIDKIRAIGRIFEQARKHKTGPERVYLNFAPSLTADLWRAQIYDGAILWDNRMDRYWRKFKAIVGITLERAPAWEGPETQIPLTNPLGSANITGLTVYNPDLYSLTNDTLSFDSGTKKVNDSGNGLANFLTGMTVKIEGSTSNDGTYTISDGGHAGYFVVNESLTDEAHHLGLIGIDGGLCNYVEIAAADIEGDLPAPVRLEITNNYNNGDYLGTVWIGHNVECDPASLNNILEGGDATGGTLVEAAGFTQNSYRYKDWAVTTETDLLTWTLSTALLNKILGRYVRFLIRFASGSDFSDLWLRLTVKVSVTTLWQGPLTLLGWGINQELASLRLPPYLLDTGNVYPLSLILSGKTAEATYTANVDFLQMMILDGWRKLVPKGYNTAYQARLVDDGIDSYLYTDLWTPDGKLGNYVAYGEPISLHPGELQRLYFQYTDDQNAGNTVRTISIKIFYRPRRLTL